MKRRPYGKPFASVALFFFLTDANRLFAGPPARIALHLAIWATFTAILFAPPSWRTKPRLGVAALLLAAESACAIFYYDEIKLLYFIAIVLFAAALRLSFARSLHPAITVLIVMAALYYRFGHADLFSFLSFVVSAVVLYFFIRNRIQRNEFHAANERHLAELRVAYGQLQEATAATMKNAVLEERTRIARHIHDAAGHSFSSLIVQLQALRYKLKENPEQARQSVDDMLDIARRGLQDIRISVHALADDRSFPAIAAMKSLQMRTETSAAIGCTFRCGLSDDELGAEAGETLFRVLQEAVTNVIRHARATQVDVSLEKEADLLVLCIRDNGESDGQPISAGFGLNVMKARLEAHQGSLSYRRLAPHGFELTATIPAPKEEM
ncbi:sensor histidine kinase [Paenibacillus cymbidii]|uniref:sensor histidine kinase n=1 Tax=Paenibacillus cymbidii TaxID=1639034 RepID=UPI0014369648|nr:sensor histidine kinase [Paenibacillus cymbidii]